MDNLFKSVDLMEAYKLVTPGMPVFIATKGYLENLYNITPIGWVCPMDYEPVTKIMFSVDPKHQCAANIKRTEEFAVCIPSNKDDPIIEKCGSISSADADKFARFGITGSKAESINVMIPKENVSSWIEMRLIRIIEEGSVEVFMGEAVAAFSL
jgi:flavin reductase (DIM6/NTAB) family NADH-FMN oxidoreductase RutF